jgi:hypothetical protein
MDTRHHPDELAQLRTTVTTLQARLAHVEHHRRLPRRLLPLLLATFLVALVPLATLAANPFTDLVPGSVHNPNIDAIYNAGITTGCVPNAEYCPTDFVTRQEMASFLARTAGLGGNPAVANALTAQTVGGYAPGDLTRFAFADQGMLNNGQDIPLPGSTGSIPAILTVSMTLPRRGVVRLTTTGVFITGSLAGCPCRAEALLSYLPNNALQSVSSTNIATAPTDLVGGLDSRPFAGAVAYPLEAGTYTFSLHVRKSVGTSTGVALTRATLQAEFLPLTGTGAQP